MAKITIQSMAKDLGLSRNTVSMALKGNPVVKEHTQELVKRHAVSVGYLEPMQALAYKGQGRTQHHIMIIRKTDEAFYWDRVMNGIAEEASRNSCQIHVAVVTPEEEKEEIFPPGLDEKIDAVFFMKLMDWKYIRKVKEYGYLVFMLDDFFGKQSDPLGDVVRINGWDGTAYLTACLIRQGMKSIGFLNENSHVCETMHDRYSGFRDTMLRHGLSLDEGIVMPDMESDSFYYSTTFDDLVDRYPKLPEAVVCGNDMIAQLLTKAFGKRGIRVPEDVAVTGFDNDEGGKINPFFSTVQVDAKWMGRRLVQSFIRRLHYPDAPFEKVLVYGKPIIRTSSEKRKNEN